MEKQQTISAVFDYTTFLGASSCKKWTFLEVFSSVVPIFGTILNKKVQEDVIPEERLWQHAMNELSTQDSDVHNLIRLLELAKDEGIDELTLMMPYDLDSQQLNFISARTHSYIYQSAQDEFTIYL